MKTIKLLIIPVVIASVFAFGLSSSITSDDLRFPENGPGNVGGKSKNSKTAIGSRRKQGRVFWKVPLLTSPRTGTTQEQNIIQVELKGEEVIDWEAEPKGKIKDFSN